MTIGLLLVNLGTPQSYRPKDVFRYLIEFLTDGRVIDVSWWRRQLLVRGLIVPLRYRQSAKQYRKLWTEKGSPLLVHGQAVKQKLQDSLGPNFQVELAMRYQQPAIEKGLEQLRHTQEIIILPLFPQYASATTGSVHQKIMEHVKQWTVIPQLTFINSYADHPGFIQALSAKVQSYQLQEYDHLLFSFHGLPERHIRKADRANHCLKENCCAAWESCNHHCYKAQCYATARALAHQLNIPSTFYTVSFQSRLGREPWLQPYTVDLVQSFAKKYKRLLVCCPAFVCDCLETTYEINDEYSLEFRHQGGEKLQLVEGLNSDPAWIKALHSIVYDHVNFI